MVVVVLGAILADIIKRNVELFERLSDLTVHLLVETGSPPISNEIASIVIPVGILMFIWVFIYEVKQVTSVFRANTPFPSDILSCLATFVERVRYVEAWNQTRRQDATPGQHRLRSAHSEFRVCSRSSRSACANSGCPVRSAASMIRSRPSATRSSSSSSP